jgi:uncharacterized protein (TIGR02145 family)
MKVSGRITILLAITATALISCGGKETQGKPAPAAVAVAPDTDTTFTDSRDGKVYRKVTIGGQTWMAENLNYDVPDDTSDVCYENSADSCAKYGRLYNWETAKNVCPAGWYLPADEDWMALADYVGGKDTAGTKLKSSTGWNLFGETPTGTDDYGFSALPGGSGDGNEGSFYDAGDHGVWWSATEYEDDTDEAWDMNMGYGFEYLNRSYGDKTNRLSVRCVAD